ncbi:8-hydroxy-dADP phosphatase [Aureococcus anophagefferens]|nr:8-hydroxy-dADP phosphatase [Aureococcus anophagefferens]
MEHSSSSYGSTAGSGAYAPVADVELATRRKGSDSLPPVRGMRLNWTVGRAALPYGVSVGRLHASDVLPRVRFNSAAAEQEEGLAFAEAFGVGISLHFKLGKLLLSLLFAAAVLQLPALALYARHGQFRAHAEPVAPYGAGSLSTPRARRRDILAVSFFAACATLALLSGAAAARDFVRRDALALRTLAPRPEHYALLLRDVSPDATAATVRADVLAALAAYGAGRPCAIEKVAVHHVLRPVLTKAVEAMAAETAAVRAEKRARARPRLSGAALRTRARSLRVRGELVALARGPRDRAIAAFVVFEVIWENLEVSEASRAARRFLVRAATLAVITSGLFAVYALRGRAIHDMADDPGPEAVATAAPTAFNATALSDDGAPEPSDPFHSAKHALAPYLTREPSAKRHALFLVLIVVCLNSVLRILVRRGAVFGAHSTRTTEQSAALLAYWASTTLNTTGCYALAAWRGAVRGASKHAEGAMLSRWYADVGVYLLTTLLWEALAPPAGALLRAAFRADALRELYRVRAFFWRRRGHPGVARAPSLGGDEALELEDRAFDLRSCLPRRRPATTATPPRRSRSTSPRRPGTRRRGARTYCVVFVGATFGAGMPLLPPLAALTLALMLAHDKWALLRERRPPPRLGAHLARTAAQIAPVAAPAHALLALWTWGDAHYTGARPFFWSRDLFFSASPATWPLAVALAVCVASNPFERQASWTRLHTWDRPDDDGAPSTPPRRGADDDGLVGRHPPWRAAVDEWERNGVVHSYDILDDAHPLLRTRHLIRRTSVLSSTTATSAASVLALLADERRRAEGEAGEEEKA